MKELEIYINSMYQLRNSLNAFQYKCIVDLYNLYNDLKSKIPSIEIHVNYCAQQKESIINLNISTDDSKCSYVRTITVNLNILKKKNNSLDYLAIYKLLSELYVHNYRHFNVQCSAAIDNISSGVIWGSATGDVSNAVALKGDYLYIILPTSYILYIPIKKCKVGLEYIKQMTVSDTIQLFNILQKEGEAV